jgi:hypothetical protein
VNELDVIEQDVQNVHFCYVYFTIKISSKSGGMAQVVEHLTRKAQGPEFKP